MPAWSASKADTLSRRSGIRIAAGSLLTCCLFSLASSPCFFTDISFCLSRLHQLLQVRRLFVELGVKDPKVLTGLELSIHFGQGHILDDRHLRVTNNNDNGIQRSGLRHRVLLYAAIIRGCGTYFLISVHAVYCKAKALTYLRSLGRPGVGLLKPIGSIVDHMSPNASNSCLAKHGSTRIERRILGAI